MHGPVDNIVNAVMRALGETANRGAHSLDDPGFHGSLTARTHQTLDGTMDFEPPRTSSVERDVRAAVEQVMNPPSRDVDWRTGSSTEFSNDPRDFFGI